MPGKRAYKAHHSIRTLGGAGNVATNLAALGVQTALIGVTGNDGNYFTVKELAERLGIRHFLVRDGSRVTTAKARLYIDDEYVLRRDEEAVHPVDEETSAAVVTQFRREVGMANAVILSDYAKGVFTKENAQAIIGVCGDRSVPVIVDFKPVNRALFPGADIIAPNQAEAASLVSGFARTRRLEGGVRRLHRLLACRNTVVTLGEDGICGYDGSAFFHVPGNDVREVCAVGCGDTVRAGLTVGYVLGLELEGAARLANDAAAVIVQKPATAVISARELAEFVRRRPESR
jgi:D-beta-D-heptose 7-phosphate kinase/D-beta-D-heptose 1-phosphate adenosyltransferase